MLNIPDACRETFRRQRSRAAARALVWLVLWAGATGTALGAQTQATEQEPEEPDYAFLAGGPYTQSRRSLQLIHQTAYGARTYRTPGGNQEQGDYLFFLRTEYGLTDRWELDFMTSGMGSRTLLNGQTLGSDFGFADSTVGVRYRFLTEENSPFTLTMGPQIHLPTGSVERGTGHGTVGLAWDVAAAKDWGGPLFLFSSLNYSVLPRAHDSTPGSKRRFTLHGLEGAAALGIRALERRRGSSHHDLHFFLEGGGAWGHEIEPGLAVGVRQTNLAWTIAPGVRYGFLTARKTLVEVGVAATIGLGPNGPKRGIVIQVQFESVPPERPR